MNRFYLVAVFTAFFLLNVWEAYSIPAKRTPFVIEQADGTKLTVRLHGDENFHFYTSEDGYLLLPGEAGILHYAELQSGLLKVSGYKATDKANRTAAEQSFIGTLDKMAITAAMQTETAQKKIRLKVPKRKALTTYPTIGEQKALIILVQYTDRKFTVSNPQKAFNDMINKEGYSENGGTGSARDFFIENSKGKYLPEFDVFGPVTLAHEMSYYGGNNYNDEDQRPEEMVIEACNQLDGQINFADYDRDHDGFVDNIYIFYAGYGEADGGPKNSVWPHAWGVFSGAEKKLVLDGVQIDSYACSNELGGGSGTHMNGIGTFCHEFSHVLGLPDLYATNYSTSFTPGEWSLMDYGPYNNDGRTPPYMSAFERYSLGWLEPVTVSATDTTFVLPDISENKAYIIKTDKANEYFLLENRQQHDWDYYIPGHGMLVWHIDYNENVWANNVVNNTAKHQYVDLEEADGSQSESTRSGDAFPGTKNVTSITDDTNPGLKSWSGSKRNLSILQITEKDGKITFSAVDPRIKPEIPVIEPATAVASASFQANWKKAVGAAYYELDVYAKENGNNNYSPGYQNKNVGDVNSFTVTGLNPETDYYYVVRGRTDSQASNDSEEIHVRTLAPAFDYYSPIAKDATEVTSSSFIANWEKLDGAENYLIYVYKVVQGEGVALTNDFSGGISGLPEDWNTTCTSIYNSNEYCGNGVPSLKFDKSGLSLESPELQSKITSVSFWCRGANTAEENVLVLSGFNGSQWVELMSVSPISNSAVEYNLGSEELGGNYKAVRFTYLKNGSGNLALDDIRIESAGMENEILPGYDGKSAGDNSSTLIEALDEETEYSYMVKAFDGTVYSKMSNEVMVSTQKNGSSIGCLKLIPGDVRLSVTGNMLTLENLSSEHAPVCIYTPLGQILESRILTEQSMTVNLPVKQIYIVRVGNLVYKIVM